MLTGGTKDTTAISANFSPSFWSVDREKDIDRFEDAVAPGVPGVPLDKLFAGLPALAVSLESWTYRRQKFKLILDELELYP